MSRPTWRGAISFGLVSVPVGLYTAVRRGDVRFRQLHRESKKPIRQRRVEEGSEQPVEQADITKGYEVADGKYIVVEPEELDQIDPEASRNIEIHDYVEQEQIDPVYYDRAYYLAPDGEAARKPYALLTEAMQRSGKVGIAQFVMRNREYLAALRADDGVLVLSTMFYNDEVTDLEEFGSSFELDVDLTDRELQMADQLIGSMSTDWCPPCYRNEHRQRVLDFLEARAQGEDVEVTAEASPQAGQVIDLMGALERSLDHARKGGGGTGGGAASRSTDAADGLSQMTRSELYELAKERDVPGRSSMTKSELIEALTASADAPGAA